MTMHGPYPSQIAMNDSLPVEIREPLSNFVHLKSESRSIGGVIRHRVNYPSLNDPQEFLSSHLRSIFEIIESMYDGAQFHPRRNHAH